MSVDGSRTSTWCYDLYGRYTSDVKRREPGKKEWVIQKFPIKGGGVLRSAMQSQMFYSEIKWIQVEGKVIV